MFLQPVAQWHIPHDARCMIKVAAAVDAALCMLPAKINADDLAVLPEEAFMRHRHIEKPHPVIGLLKGKRHLCHILPHRRFLHVVYHLRRRAVTQLAAKRPVGERGEEGVYKIKVVFISF